MIAGGIAVVKKRRPRSRAGRDAAQTRAAAARHGRAVQEGRGLAGGGEPVAARRALEQALSERPKDGRVRYMLGRVAYADDNHDEALTPLPRGDRPRRRVPGRPRAAGPRRRDVGRAAKQADGALDLLIDKIGAPAADLLEKVANEGTDLTRRQRAATALDDIGQGKRVDQVSLAMLELKKARDLRGAEGPGREAARRWTSPRALPALRALRGRTWARSASGAPTRAA